MSNFQACDMFHWSNTYHELFEKRIHAYDNLMLPHVKMFIIQNKN